MTRTNVRRKEYPLAGQTQDNTSWDEWIVTQALPASLRDDGATSIQVPSVRTAVRRGSVR